MSRRLLLGRAGTGKTHACLDRLTAHLRDERKALLLVPTDSQAEHLRTLLLDRTGGLSLHAIATFTRLAERLTDRNLRNITAAPVRDRVAGEALRAHFPKAAGQPGFRAEFLAAVKEIKEQGRADALDVARVHFAADTRGRRLFEAFARYRDAMPGFDHEDLLVEARDRLRAQPLGIELLLVDGFHDFTPVQKQMLDLLADQARETVVTLPLDPRRKGLPLFATAAATAASLTGYEEEHLETNRRALPHLEQRLFAPPGDRVPGTGIEVCTWPSEEIEADRLARRIAVADRPFNDFLVVRRSFEGLHGLYAAAFRRHGVPLRFFGSEPLGRTPAARAVTLWLRWLDESIELRDVLPLLRSPYLLDAPPAREVDRLTRYLRAKGRPDTLDEWPAVMAHLERPAEGSLPDHLARRFGVREAIERHPDGSLDIARAARFFRVLQQEAEAAADLPLREAAVWVERRVAHVKDRFRDRRHDCVYAVEASEARQWEKPVVIVAGLTADSFPRQHRQDIFLRDDERKALSEQRGLALPLRARREDEERYLFYVALTRASERLVLSRPTHDEEGTARAASPYLDETLDHFEPIDREPVALHEQFAPAPGLAVSRHDLVAIVAHGLRRGDPLAAALYEREAVDRALIARPRRLALARLRPLPPLPEGALDHLSASSINDFRKCPYLLLMKKVLKVRPPREEGFDPILRGNIVHRSLQEIVRGGGEAGAVFDATWEEMTHGLRLGLFEEAERRWMRGAVIRAAEDMRGQPVEAVELDFETMVGDVKLKGTIDRLDRYPAGRLVRDYKTGKPKSEAALRDDVQLDTYLLVTEDAAGAVFEHVRQGEAVGFVVDELADVVQGRKVKRVTRDDLVVRRAEMRRIVAEVAAEARAGRLMVRPRDPEQCERARCDGFDLCRVHRARWLAKAAREPEE